jgi:hypothetical protein
MGRVALQIVEPRLHLIKLKAFAAATTALGGHNKLAPRRTSLLTVPRTSFKVFNLP